MNITIEFRGKKYYVESDGTQYIVYSSVYVDKNGNKQKKGCQYPSSLPGLADCLFEKAMKNSDATTLEALYREVVDFKNMIHDKLSI